MKCDIMILTISQESNEAYVETVWHVVPYGTIFLLFRYRMVSTTGK